MGHSAAKTEGVLEGARAAHQALFEGVEEFFEDYDVLVIIHAKLTETTIYILIHTISMHAICMIQ